MAQAFAQSGHAPKSFKGPLIRRRRVLRLGPKVKATDALTYPAAACCIVRLYMCLDMTLTHVAAVLLHNSENTLVKVKVF